MERKNRAKKLGLWMSISLVMGNMIGAGIFLIPSALAPYGGISILGWILSAIGALVLALLFGRLSKLIPGQSGGPYVYSRAGLGEFIGFLVAWGYWNSIWVSNAAIAVAFVGALSVFIPVLATNAVYAVIMGLMAIWFLTWVNSRGVHATGRMQLVTTGIKIIPLLLVTAIGIFYFDTGNFTPFNPSALPYSEAIAITVTLTLYAFLGIECATIPAASVEDPKKNIPRATIIGTSLTILLYIGSSVVVMGMIPLAELANSPAPFADAMAKMAGDSGQYIVAAGAAIAAFGALNGWILVQGQIAMATAQDKLFPRFFRKKNRNGVPFTGILFGSVLTSILMVMNYTEGLVEQFRFMILLTTICCLVPYLFSAIAYWFLSSRKAKSLGAGVLILGLLALLFSLWAIYGAGSKAILWGIVLLLAGIPLFLWLKGKHSKDDVSPDTDL